LSSPDSGQGRMSGFCMGHGAKCMEQKGDRVRSMASVRQAHRPEPRSNPLLFRDAINNFGAKLSESNTF